MSKKPKLSLIIPAYNEAPCLRQSIYFIKKAVESFSKSYEIIIAEDGSRDGTDKIAATLVKENQHMIHSHSNVRLGKGQALKKALAFSSQQSGQKGPVFDSPQKRAYFTTTAVKSKYRISKPPAKKRRGR